ncbi:hypothetical protein AB0J38_10935 [Streptomyces sp. NPDC050095]|uniref:hypothetical protein n=1 Tax=unclassified Streptomyces TaxID=2593676 RepID=UPI0034303028
MRMRWGHWGVWAAGVGCLLALCFGGFSAARQWQLAERIDGSPVRVRAAVTSVEKDRKHWRQTLSYELDGRPHQVRRELGDGPGSPPVGAHRCLEADRTRPTLTRLCGERYPGGDDLFATYLLVAVAGLVGCGVVLGIARWHRREAAREATREASNTPSDTVAP